ALRAILYEYGHVFPLRIVKVKWIDAWIKTLKDVAKESETSRRLQSMLGVGSLKELADEAFAPKMAHFCCGRDFAAWLGLVSRQHSKGGKDRMGRSAAFVSATKVSFRSERA
ncbi:MAG: transposase, partial [Rhodobacterales bacterium]